MPAYLLLLAAILSRPGLLFHSGWPVFTAIGGSLLYFGARRSWKEMLLPVAALAAVDYYLTTHVYGYDFVWQDYLITWAWYAAAIVLGFILLHSRVSVLRVASAAILGPTSFFLASNYAVWVVAHNPGGMYAPNFGGLLTCFAAGLPFYERDLASTAIVLTVAFGAPIMIRKFQSNRQLPSQPLL
ncbi:MAG TPA: DUF6580 family putative transport protein [Acidobacteriaceae bacterium]|jgi:hypothetical protein|nr:DUF6580 family putative transport protein [Acidobacteriaceae bacterium]